MRRPVRIHIDTRRVDLGQYTANRGDDRQKIEVGGTIEVHDTVEEMFLGGREQAHLLSAPSHTRHGSAVGVANPIIACYSGKGVLQTPRAKSILARIMPYSHLQRDIVLHFSLDSPHGARYVQHRLCVGSAPHESLIRYPRFLTQYQQNN